MNSTPLRRPLGPLKHLLRQKRTYANAILKPAAKLPPAPPTPTPRFLAIENKDRDRNSPHTSKRYRTGFAVYTTPQTAIRHLALTHPHLTKPAPDPVGWHHAYQIRKMDPSGQRTRLFAKDNPNAAHPGDVLLVTTKRAAEPFAGVLIGVRRRGIETSILLRSQLTRVGVEMYFKVYSRNVTGIEIIKRAAKRARRARLTYLRKPKHDVGSVEHLVRAWKRSRHAYASLGKKGKTQKKKKKVDF